MKIQHGTFRIFAGASCLLLATACCGPVSREALLKDARYWQRADVRESSWMEGAPAQEMLHADISRCVADIGARERFEPVRIATPANTGADGSIPDPQTPEGVMAQWDTPDHDNALLAEHMDYHDFETCMQARGWERIVHMTDETGERARKTYVESILKIDYEPKETDPDRPKKKNKDSRGDWDEVNR